MHTMLGPVIAIFFMLCIERVESTPLGEFAETCASSDAQKQANCPSANLGVDDYRADITAKKKYAGVCTCPQTTRMYSISAETCNDLLYYCEGGIVTSCVDLLYAPTPKGLEKPYHKVQMRVTCRPGTKFTEKDARCKWSNGKCTSNPEYTKWSAEWNANVKKCEGNCVDTVWSDDRGNKCTDYVSNRWCNTAGRPGPNWPREFGDFKDVRGSHGLAPNKACCACNGGITQACAVRESRDVVGFSKKFGDKNCEEHEGYGVSIKDKDRCIRAAAMMGAKLDIFAARNMKNEPKGCFVSQGYATFNIHGTGKANAKSKPICVLASDWKVFCPAWCINWKGSKPVCTFPKCLACPVCKGVTINPGSTASRFSTTGRGPVVTTNGTNSGAGANTITGGNTDDGSGVVVACVVVFFVILGLGGGGFAAYWFILRQKGKRAKSPLGTPAPTPVPEPEANASYISTKSETDEARQVSKPVLLEVNGAAVDEKSSDSDDTIDESDEEQKETPALPTQPKPALPTQPKPPVPVVSPRGTASSPKPPPPEPKLPTTSPKAADFLDDDSDYHDGH